MKLTGHHIALLQAFISQLKEKEGGVMHRGDESRPALGISVSIQIPAGNLPMKGTYAKTLKVP